jgi:hypothetical protein
VVHEMMLTARKGLPGHAIYGIVRSAMELIESCGRERELRREAVRSMVAAGATDVELIGAFEDAWILEDPEWVAGVEGGRDVLSKQVLTVDKEEGRVVGLELSRKWKGEALPASVARLTALRELKMRDCKSLKSVAVLPASVTQIGKGAFFGCTSLASITLPESVTQIGEEAFRDCKSLASITIPASVTQIGREAFFNCTSLASITLPESVTQIGEEAFRGCISLASITIPESVTQIGGYTFEGCTSLASITIPASVTEIGEYAFRGCASLASITLPASVTQIGGGAFSGCTSLASITLPESVTQIGWSAFHGCRSLVSITLPESVTEIHGHTFYGCASLASITIPKSVTQIGYQAFIDCKSLSLFFRSHHRPSWNRAPLASTLKSPAHRPALERAARKTNRPHISLWRVPATRRAMPRRHQPRPTHRGCPARRRGLGHSNGRRDTGVASTRSPEAPHTASHERAPAARTYMWGRVRHARRFRNASCERPRAWLRRGGRGGHEACLSGGGIRPGRTRRCGVGRGAALPTP